MSVPAKDIHNFMIKELDMKASAGDRLDTYYAKGYNQARFEISERRLTLNREKLARELYCIRIGVNVNPKRWYEIGGDYKKQYYDFEDSIISSLPSLIEYDE